MPPCPLIMYLGFQAFCGFSFLSARLSGQEEVGGLTLIEILEPNWNFICAHISPTGLSWISQKCDDDNRPAMTMTCLGRRNTHRHSGHRHQGSWTSAINTILIIRIILCWLWSCVIYEICFCLHFTLFCFSEHGTAALRIIFILIENPGCRKSRRTGLKNEGGLELDLGSDFPRGQFLISFWLPPWWINCEPEVCVHYWG